MGKEVLVDLSHPFGAGSPLWPYFEDVKIERMHYMGRPVPENNDRYALHHPCRFTRARI